MHVDSMQMLSFYTTDCRSCACQYLMAILESIPMDTKEFLCLEIYTLACVCLCVYMHVCVHVCTCVCTLFFSFTLSWFFHFVTILCQYFEDRLPVSEKMPSLIFYSLFYVPGGGELSSHIFTRHLLLFSVNSLFRLFVSVSIGL